jgi:hypothetical protein
MGQVRGLDPAGTKAISDGVPGIAGIALLSSEPFFLRRRHDFSVAKQAGGTIVVERGDSQDVGRHGHACSIGAGWRLRVVPGTLRPGGRIRFVRLQPVYDGV